MFSYCKIIKYFILFIVLKIECNFLILYSNYIYIIIPYLVLKFYFIDFILYFVFIFFNEILYHSNSYTITYKNIWTLIMFNFNNLSLLNI